jgi:hypothetical protein
MSSSDSEALPDLPDDQPDQPEAPHESAPQFPAELDPAIAEAVDGVTNRFGAEGLEQMIEYAEQSLAQARAALAELVVPD